ncbi:MAG: hypothetical protein ACK5KP_12940 [Paludibacteraceae bacterium]
MKTWDLNNYGVQEMNAAEMMKVNGGGIFSTIWQGVCYVASSIYDALAYGIGEIAEAYRKWANAFDGIRL